jgi:hypothetical protein
VKDRTSDFAKMSPAAAVSVSQLALPVGAMPAVGFGCWKLGKNIAADTSKGNPIDLSNCFQFLFILALPQVSFNSLVLQTRIRLEPHNCRLRICI